MFLGNCPHIYLKLHQTGGVFGIICFDVETRNMNLTRFFKNCFSIETFDSYFSAREYSSRDLQDLIERRRPFHTGNA